MKLNYKVIGEGKPVIILHGLFGMSDNLQTFAKQLSTHGFASYLVDLRNHSHSPHSEVHNYKVMAEDVSELINALDLKDLIVFGHSMGGKVALQMLNDSPQNISKLIVVDIAPYAYPVHHREILDALLSLNLDEIKSRGEAEKHLAISLPDNGTRQFLLKNLYWIQPEKLAWRFNLPVLNENIEEVGKATWPSEPVSTPVLFIRGEKSKYINPDSYSEIKKLYPSAEFVTIENAGHWVHADQPQKLLETVLTFIS